MNIKKITLSIVLIPSIIISTQAQDLKKWELSSTNSAVYYEGNSVKFDFTTDNQVNYLDSNYEFTLRYQYLYGEQDKERYLLEHQASVNYERGPFDRFSRFVNASVLHNIYKGFDLRANLALGSRYRFIYKANMELSLSAALLLDRLDFASPLNEIAPERNNETYLRLSIRPKLKWKLSEKLSLNHFTYYQPQLADFNNYIIQSQSSIDIQLSKLVSLSIGHYLFFNSEPAYASIQSNDQRITVGLKFSNSN